MRFDSFRSILSSLNQLSHAQRQLLINRLNRQDNLIISQLEQQLEENPQCPHCKSSNFTLFGRYQCLSGTRQRYRCKSCNKTFTCTAGTKFFRLRYSDHWLDYLYSMLDSMVLREAASQCNISLFTSFHWRHRFLIVPDHTKSPQLSGIVEADETYFRYSEKGSRRLGRAARRRGERASTRGLNHKDWVPVLVAIDRSHHEFDQILTKVTSQTIEEALAHTLTQGSILCTDGQRAYNKLVSEEKILHKVIKEQRVIEGSFHIQTVNSYHSGLKGWMYHFRGVATKYLSHYLGWFRLLRLTPKPENDYHFKLLELQQHLT